jgi:hypothetical protein
MSVAELQYQLDEALTDYRANVDKLTQPALKAKAARVKSLQFELSAAITEGAKRCPQCGEFPCGMVQNIEIKGAAFQGYEIGCTVCVRSNSHNPAAFGLSRDEAVSNWNAGPSKWMTPKPRDAKGNRV